MLKRVSVILSIGLILALGGDPAGLATKNCDGKKAHAKTDATLKPMTHAQERAFYQKLDERRARQKKEAIEKKKARELEVQHLRDQVAHYEELMEIEPYAELELAWQENELLREQLSQFEVREQNMEELVGLLAGAVFPTALLHTEEPCVKLSPGASRCSTL